MFKIYASNEKSAYEVNELAKMFLPQDQFELEIDGKDLSKNSQKQNAYKALAEFTGRELDWGILTGVRPSKLFNQLVRDNGFETASRLMKDEYYLSERKVKLLQDIYTVQKGVVSDEDRYACGVYIGIPFCPSRCLYCSFTSNVISKEKATAYMAALEKEISETKRIMDREGLYAESVYIGGGTPSSLDDEDFEKLLSLTKKHFINQKTVEWTVEAGRPDTITRSKLELIEKYGANRISINPQTMKDETLKTIGRHHSSQQIIEAYNMAREFPFIVNMDLICGLPNETAEDFENTLTSILKMNPDNITVHTLAVKKASKLIEIEPEFAFKQAKVVEDMLGIASELLSKEYKPYYMYRQKHMAGNFENVGYCKNNTASLYNIRIMEENQSIIALGAGGISKIYYPAENRLERVANVSNYEIYIERIDEMIQRKDNGIVL